MVCYNKQGYLMPMPFQCIYCGKHTSQPLHGICENAKKKMKKNDHDEKTYRSTNTRIIQTIWWCLSIYTGFGIWLFRAFFFGTILFKYEQRLRLVESRTIAFEERVNELKSIHDAEIEEIQKWYKKSVQVDLNPLNVFKRKLGNV